MAAISWGCARRSRGSLIGTAYEKGNDCRAEHSRLAEQGVQFVREPAEETGFVVATLLDPDGNMVQLFEEMARG